MNLEELLKNVDVISIAKSSFNKHARIIRAIDNSRFLKKQLIEEGIWNAQKHYKENMDTSFLTYVYLRVRFVCLTFIRNHINKNKNTINISSIAHEATEYDNPKNNFSTYINHDIEIIDILDSLKPKERDLLSKVYIENMKVEDIARDKKVTEHTILQQLNKIIKNIKLSINS